MNALETHVLELIGENVDSPDVFVDTDAGLEPIRESLNDAIDEITFLTGSYKRTYQVFLAQDQCFYRINLKKGEMAWITDVWLVGERRRLTQTDICSLSFQNPRWLDNNGSPYQYFTVGSNVVGFTPIPSGTTDIVEISMVVVPERMTTSNDRIYIRDSLRFAAVYYAVSNFHASRGDAKESTSWMKKYLDEIGMMGIYPKYQEKNYQFGNRTNAPTP